jgi:hypothetical protein
MLLTIASICITASNYFLSLAHFFLFGPKITSTMRFIATGDLFELSFEFGNLDRFQIQQLGFESYANPSVQFNTKVLAFFSDSFITIFQDLSDLF